MNGRERIYPARLALYYALLSGAYILLSDRLLALFISDPVFMSRVQTYKGWVFVAISAWLIYLVVSRQMRKIAYEIAERERTQEELRWQLNNLDVLHDISSVLRNEENLHEMLPLLLDKTMAALNTTAGTISLYHTVTGKLQHAVSRGWFAELGKTSERPKEGISGRVYATGKPYITRDFASDPLTRKQNRTSIPQGWSGVCVPFQAQSKTVGVIFVGFPHPREINSKELKLLTSLSEMTGTALHRAILHEETVSRLKQLQSLRAIDLAITSSQEMRPTLEVLLREAQQQLNVEAAAISLLHADGSYLEHAASQGVVEPLPIGSRIQIDDSVLSRAVSEQVPILESCHDQGQHEQCILSTHAEGFVGCLNSPLVTKGRVVGVMTLFSSSPFPVSLDWWSYMETLGGQAAIAIDNAQMFSRLEQAQRDLLEAYDATIEGWAFALDLRDEETQGHSRRVTEATVDLARKLGFDDEQLVHVRRGAMLHDVGKMGIPDAILQKPGPLSDTEWVIMRTHPHLAREMLNHIEYLKPALAIPYSHHEKWDGTGYPQGLKGAKIPLEARVFAVVDVYDALTSDRPYRKAWGRKRALEYINEQRNTHFDPQVVDLFLAETPL